MITIDADETDLAAVLEALAPGKVTIENGEITAVVNGKPLRLTELELELHSEVAFDQLRAGVNCRISDGQAHIEAEVR